jgi:hypothetical protein
MCLVLCCVPAVALHWLTLFVGCLLSILMMMQTVLQRWDTFCLCLVLFAPFYCFIARLLNPMVTDNQSAMTFCPRSLSSVWPLASFANVLGLQSSCWFAGHECQAVLHLLQFASDAVAVPGTLSSNSSTVLVHFGNLLADPRFRMGLLAGLCSSSKLRTPAGTMLCTCMIVSTVSASVVQNMACLRVASHGLC